MSIIPKETSYSSYILDCYPRYIPIVTLYDSVFTYRIYIVVQVDHGHMNESATAWLHGFILHDFTWVCIHITMCCKPYDSTRPDGMFFYDHLL